MTPPLLARALVAVATAPAEYGSISGDLHEEYALLAAVHGRAIANRWYWSQAIRSLPSLLGLSRTEGGFLRALCLVLIIAATLVVMLLVGALTNGTLDHLYGGIAPLWLHFVASWCIAIVAGYFLCATTHSHGVRIAIETSFFFVAAFAVPSLMHISSTLYPLTWLLLLGVISSMTLGASLQHTARRL